MNKGFTLIELLVVVLIIGILSSVALPQYQKSVDKSRAAAVWPVLKTMSQAVNVCMLANDGDSTACDTTNLDVELPATDCKFSFERATCNYYNTTQADKTGGVIWGRPPSGFGLGIGADGKRFCIGNEEGCKALGFKTSLGGSPYKSWATEYTE